MAAPSQRQENLATGSRAQAEAGRWPPQVLVQYQSDSGLEYSALALAIRHNWFDTASVVNCEAGGEDVVEESGDAVEDTG